MERKKAKKEKRSSFELKHEKEYYNIMKILVMFIVV